MPRCRREGGPYWTVSPTSFFLLYVGVMLKATLRYALESIELRETTMSPWDPPIYPIKAAMVAALALLLLQGTVKFIRDLNRAVKGDVS